MKFLSLLSLLATVLASPAQAAFFHGGSYPAFIPLLDYVKCSDPADAAYGTVRLRSAYGGYAGEMRVKQSGVYVYRSIGFSGNVIDSATADTFAATADVGTPPEIRFFDQCGNGNDTTFSGTAANKGAIWSVYPFGNTSLRFASFDLLYDNPNYSAVQQLVLPSSIALNMDAFSTVLIGRLSAFPPRVETLWELNNTAPWTARLYGYNTDIGINALEKVLPP